MNNKFSALLVGSEQSIKYMIKEITHICKNMGSRSPCSKGERKAAEYMAGVLNNDCGLSARLEEFSTRPQAFYSYFYFSAVLDCLCAVSFFVTPWLSLLLGLAALALLILQFVLYKPIINPLYASKSSVNVTAVRPCSKQVTQRILFSGHMDAAWEFPLNYHCGGVVFELPGIFALTGVLYYIALCICALCGAGAWVNTAGLCGLGFILFFVLVAFTYNPKRVVDGANDNLSGCLISITLLRELERLGVTLEHTEVGVVLTGCEEAGLCGAKAWSKAHKDDYNDVPTYIVGIDTIHDPRCLMVNARDLNGTVVTDKALCKAIINAAESAKTPIKAGKVPLLGGATDSAAFTGGGFRSACITGLSHKLEKYYHTRMDSYDNLQAEGLEYCYKLAVCLIEYAEQNTIG